MENHANRSVFDYASPYEPWLTFLMHQESVDLVKEAITRGRRQILIWKECWRIWKSITTRLPTMKAK